MIPFRLRGRDDVHEEMDEMRAEQVTKLFTVFQRSKHLEWLKYLKSSNDSAFWGGGVMMRRLMTMIQIFNFLNILDRFFY